MSKQEEKRMYKFGQELFFGYLFGKVSSNTIEELNNKYIEVSGKSFYKSYCDDNGFKDIEDAKNFGNFCISYYNKHKTLPNGIPEKSFLLKIIKSK